MATLIIDPSLHVAQFPATYTGPGTLIGNTLQTGSQDTQLYGYFTSVAGDPVQINCGFRPLYVRVFNDTDGVKWEWQWGMAATHSFETTNTGPVSSIDTTSAIVVNTDIAGDCTVTLSTALCGAAKNICFTISG
jgi:hypothetical protein